MFIVICFTKLLAGLLKGFDGKMCYVRFSDFVVKICGISCDTKYLNFIGRFIRHIEELKHCRMFLL
jgi:hypothetical protein